MRHVLICLFVVLCARNAAMCEETPSLKLAIIAPVEPWDRQEGIEAFRDWLIENYRVEVIWIEPATHQPTNETAEAERKAYYETPPAIPDLAKAGEADVIYTALTHCALNERDTVEYFKLLASKPLIGGRRSHHGLYFRKPKDQPIPALEEKDGYGMAVFGGKYAGHHGGAIRFKEGQANHPIVTGLDELVKLSLTDRGYKHVLADDVTVLIESEHGQPQVWARTRKDTKQRVFYLVHDPRDIQQHEVVRQMMARALFWVTERTEADYKKKS